MNVVAGEVSARVLGGRSGRGVRVAVVDSGIHASHPHVQGVTAGCAFDARGTIAPDFADRLGHGTAVAAAIREKAPAVELLAGKIFDRKLTSTSAALLAAVRWALAQRPQLVNLSLGTAGAATTTLTTLADEAAAAATVIVAAAPEAGTAWPPSQARGLVGVELDWDCPRDTLRYRRGPAGALRLRASGYPRPIPGVPPERNLSGLSFSVANATGILALLLEDARPASAAALLDRLLQLGTPS